MEGQIFGDLIKLISQRNNTMPGENLDWISKDVLRFLGEHFGVNYVTFGYVSKSGKIQATDMFWVSNDLSQQLSPGDNTGAIPHTAAQLVHEGAFVFNNPGEFQNWLPDRKYLGRLGVKSGAIVVLHDAGDSLECLTLYSVRNVIAWPTNVVEQLSVCGEIILSTLRHQQSENEIITLRNFERMVLEIAVDFIGVSPERLDSKIEDVLGRVCEYLQLELGTLLQWNGPDKSYLDVTHEWGSDTTNGPYFKGIRVDDEFRYLFGQLKSGRSYLVNQLDDFGEGAETERAACKRIGIQSVLWVPFGQTSEISGFIALNSLTKSQNWPDDIVQHLQLVGHILAHSLTRKHNELLLRSAYDEILELKSQLECENTHLRVELNLHSDNQEIIGTGFAMQRLMKQIHQVAPTDTTVLLQGETGTGKGLVASTIHRLSLHRKQALVTVNCAALPAPLIESELFGHEKGAFTGAIGRKAGRFEMADKGTLFLDEIGDLPLELQPKLLRVLQHGEFERVGSSKTQRVDVRVIAATNRNLEMLVSQGTFRADLYYRLSVFPIVVPPLRERRDDIILLVWFFVERLQYRFKKRFNTISHKDMEALKAYHWPGNVRELSNFVERAMILSSAPKLEFANVPTGQQRTGGTNTATTSKSGAHLEDIEREHIKRVLNECDWRVRGEGGAAQRLGLKRSTLQSKMKKLGIQRPANLRHGV